MKTVFFFDNFNDYTAEFLIKDLALAAKEDKNVRLIINSPGGVVTSLLSIVDSINLIDMNLETVCIGQAASCGAVLFSLGKKRYITQNARIILHQVSGGMWGNIQDVEIQAEEAKRINDTMLDILSGNIKKDKETLKQDLNRDLILTADQAVAYGIADSIINENVFTNEIQLFKKNQFEEAVKNTLNVLATEKEVKLYKIPNKELFKAGTYKGKTYSEKDVEDLVKNTNYLIEKFDFKVPIKLGHDNHPELSEMFKDMLKSDSMPAFGYIENIRKEVSSVIGDLVNIPEPIYNLIDKQFFCKKSPEIWNTYRIKDETLGYVLDSIALLGATQPEIPDLFTKDSNKGDEIMPGQEKDPKHLTEEEIKAKIEEESRQKEELAKKDQATKEAETRAKKAEDELAALKTQTRKEKIESRANEVVEKGAIFPYQKKAFAAVLDKIDGIEEKVNFSKDEKEQELELAKAFEDLFINRPTIDLTKNYSENSTPSKEEKNLSEDEKLANNILEAAGYSSEEIKEME